MNMSENPTTTIPSHIKYKIRMPASSVPSTKMLSQP